MKSQDYSKIRTYYHGALSYAYRCSYCMHSNDGTPGKICKGCGSRRRKRGVFFLGELCYTVPVNNKGEWT